MNITSCCALESIPEIRDESAIKWRNDNYLRDTTGKNKTKEWMNSWAQETEISENHDDAIKRDKYSTFHKSCDLTSENNTEGINQLSSYSSNINTNKILNKHNSNIKDSTFSLPIGSEIQNGEFMSNDLQSKTKHDSSRLRRLPVNVKDKYMFGNSRPLRTSNVLGHDKSSDMVSVKTEESVQEWLTRISDWVDNNTSAKEDDRNNSDYSPVNEEDWTRSSSPNETHSQNSTDQSKVDVIRNIFDDLLSEASTHNTLSKATKESPANLPMVVMQCSRLHSHISSKPPFQQTSLPMGTLVTALYEESGWLYVQTPHGVEGFITPSNCVPIGTVQGKNQPKRPWEPCDFPIEIRIRNSCDFDIHETFVHAKLPTNSGKRPGPFVSVFRTKTNFYNDRYYNTTFKLRDSIKTAKTVTDILRNSPEIKVSEQ